MTAAKRETQLWDCHSSSFISLNLNDLKFKNTECNESRDHQETRNTNKSNDEKPKQKESHRPDDRKWKNDEKITS